MSCLTGLVMRASFSATHASLTIPVATDFPLAYCLYQQYQFSMVIESQKAAKPLTKKQARILEYIQTRLQWGQIPPTHDEIKREFKLGSAFGVRQHLRLIQNKGHIETLPGKSRGIQLLQGTAAERPSLLDIPIVGCIAAGQPILAEENLEGSIAVGNDLFPCGVLFALRVRGVSMIKVGIRTGDLAIIRQQPEVENGEIAAVLRGNEATLKRFCVDQGSICLKAENDDEPDIPIDDRLGAELRILGLYVGLIRQAR
jgi:repressor LexA